MAEVELSIVIISYNTRDLTLACLESLRQHPPSVSHEVIVLDNASPDRSMDEIEARFPNVVAIRNRENVGFAAANNLAAERAAGRRILLLNPDTVILEGTFDALWSFAEREPDRGIWGGRTLFPDGSLNPTSCWRRPTIWSMFCGAVGLTHMFPRSPLLNAEAYGDWQRDEQREVDIVTGCFLLIDTALWRRLGGFDRTFFMYAEEADLCLRARRLGARPAITPAAQLIHYGGASEATSAGKVVKTVRGRITFMRKHWARPNYLIGCGLLLFWSFVRMLASGLVSGRKDQPGTSRQKWHEIWNRRSEWLAGYAAPPQTEGGR